MLSNIPNLFPPPHLPPRNKQNLKENKIIPEIKVLR